MISTRKKEQTNVAYQESQTTNLFEELGLKLLKIPNVDLGGKNAAAAAAAASAKTTSDK